MNEMLVLNPNDNQGISHILITKLLILRRFLEVEKLFEDYKDDISAQWQYAKAYLYFNKRSKRLQADKALAEAMKYNPFVPLFLFALIEMPDELPEYMGFGDENEAIVYVDETLELWANDAKALKWFIELHHKMEEDLDTIIEQRLRDREKIFGKRYKKLIKADRLKIFKMQLKCPTKNLNSSFY